MLSQRLAPATPSRSDGLTSRDGAPPPRPALPSGANFLKAERVGRRHGRRAPMRRHPEGRRPHLLRSEPCSTVYATPAPVQQYHALRVGLGSGLRSAALSAQSGPQAAGLRSGDGRGGGGSGAQAQRSAEHGAAARAALDVARWRYKQSERSGGRSRSASRRRSRVLYRIPANAVLLRKQVIPRAWGSTS